MSHGQVQSHTQTTMHPATVRRGFLEEDNGKKSSMRLMSFLALIASIGFGIVTLMHKGASDQGIYITFGFLLAAFAPKALQKVAESKHHPFQ